MIRQALSAVLIFFLFSLIGMKSKAQGWVITESNNTMTYISNGWVKTMASGEEESNITSMFNADKDIIIMLDNTNQKYAKGSGQDYCDAMKSIMDERNKRMPPDQQKMMQDMINQQKAKPAPKITVKKEVGKEIAGYHTDKYSVFADGQLFEEKWLTTDPSLKNILDITKASQNLTSKLVTCGVPDESFLKSSPEFSAEYKKLDVAGVEMKSISYEYGNPDTRTDVVSIEKEDIPSSEFEVPDGYSESSFKDMISEMSEE